MGSEQFQIIIMSGFMSIETLFQQFFYMKQAFICGSFIGLKGMTSNLSVNDVLLVMWKKNHSKHLHQPLKQTAITVPTDTIAECKNKTLFSTHCFFSQVIISHFQAIFWLPESWTAGKKGRGSKGGLKWDNLSENDPAKVHLSTKPWQDTPELQHGFWPAGCSGCISHD